MKSKCDIQCDKHNEQVEKAVNATLEYLEFDKPCEVSVSFVSSEEMQELNAKYRDLNEPTDVLSFPQDDWDSEIVALGDIVICEELCEDISMLTIHSVLHLFGYDHHDGTKTMFTIQDKILEALNAETN